VHEKINQKYEFVGDVNMHAHTKFGNEKKILEKKNRMNMRTEAQSVAGSGLCAMSVD